MNIFEALLIHPIYNLLIWLSDILTAGNVGLAIIILTIIIKGALFPLTFKSMRSQREMQELQPKIKKIREQYKDDKEKMAQELMAIYKDHNVNPFASCLPLFIQLPVFLALFRVLRGDIGVVDQDILYSFVQVPETLNSVFLGISLTEISIVLAVLAAIFQYLQIRFTMSKRPEKSVRKSSGAMDEDMAANMQRMMMFFIPGLTLIIGSTSLPAGIMLYWLTTTVLTIILYKIFLPKKKVKADIVDVEAK